MERAVQIEPTWILAACAIIGLLITWTTTVIGAALWVVGKINKVKSDILKDFSAKHEENRVRVDAIQALVIRHETILDPEFNGSGHRMSKR